MGTILVFVEQRDGEIKKVSFENLTLAKSLAQEKNNEHIAVLIGNKDPDLVQNLSKYGVKKVIAYYSDKLSFYNSEAYSKILADAVKEHDAKLVLLGATAMGKDLAPRIAARLDAALATDCISLEWKNDDLEIIRPMYAGKVRATVKLNSEIKIVTVRPNIYLVEENPTTPGISEKNVDPGDSKAIVQEILAGAKDKLDVTEADIIVSGGRGLKGPENFHLIEKLAKKLGAAQGASRAVVDAGWRPYDEQVGQTGKTVSPSLYIAVGISGAIQHLAGMSSSKYIVAINKDPEAPIFKIADYGIVGDAFEVIPKLIEEL
jgi:electron transfer flavoprotein alpha subunit